MSVRVERLSATIRRALQDAMARGVHDPRVRGMITITGVDLTPDLRTATVRISVLPESAQELSLHGLRSAAGRLRRDIEGAVRLKRMPVLAFQLDDTFKRQARVLSAIARSRESDHDEQNAGAPQPAQAEEPLVGPDQPPPSSPDPAP